MKASGAKPKIVGKRSQSTDSKSDWKNKKAGDKKGDFKNKDKRVRSESKFGDKKRDVKSRDKDDAKNVKKGGKFEVVKQDAPKSAAKPVTRREKQKVSDLIKKLRINHNKLMMKKKDISNEEKHKTVAECIELCKDKYAELSFKHDGCRVLQALVKFGNKPQRETVVKNLMPLYIDLMSSKYSHYLASKAYLYAGEEQRAAIRKEVLNSIQKLILHSFASEVVEYIYC